MKGPPDVCLNGAKGLARPGGVAFESNGVGTQGLRFVRYVRARNRAGGA